MKQVPKCIIFDWDGTLVGCEQLVHAAYVLTLDKLEDKKASSWTPEQTHAQNGKTRAEIFENADIWGEKGGKAQEIFYHIYPRLQQGDKQLVGRFECISGTTLNPLTVFEGAKEVVLSLKRQMPKTRIVLLGAKTQELLEKEVQEAGFEGLFDAVLGNTGNPITDKPNKGAFDRAVQGLSIADKTADVLYVGDNPQNDTAFANAWGADIKIVQPKKDKTVLYVLKSEFEQTYPICGKDNVWHRSLMPQNVR
ncbi:MAG: HAD family hydrolase [Alphaproteobacteria bacterium]|nr:HAD family hydrolase [Alphaproteobacteria bacterium]